MRPRGRRLLWMIPVGIVGMTLFIFLGGEIVKLLWNWLVPPLFGWRMITFWQGLGILLLCRILFGHHGWRGGPRHAMRRRMMERMNERWEQMTPEEREKMRQRWRGRCGPWEPPPAETTPGA